MRVKFTIAVCALLMLGLAVTQVNAQGFSVSKSETDVALHGRNQMMGAIRLDYVDTGGNIDDGRTIKIVYGGLYITSTSAEVTSDLDCMGFTCGTGANEVVAVVANDDDTGIGTVTINMRTARPATGERYVVVRRVRADVSGLSAGDTIVASINSATAPTGFVPIGQERTESVGGTVSTVTGGLAVKVGQASRLLCNIGDLIIDAGTDLVSPDDDITTPIGGVPSITVSEAFPTAWEHTGVAPGAGNTDVGQTMITIKMLNLPTGVTLRWPHVVPYIDPNDDGDQTWSMLSLTENSRLKAGGGATDGAGTDDAEDGVEETNGDTVTYEYATTTEGRTGDTTNDTDVTTEMDSFKIEIIVSNIDLDKVGAGGISDIWAWLAPPGDTGDDDDREGVLSYNMSPVTDPEVDNGDIINFGECVTYLMFPYLTCGDSANWTTAIAIANTTMDDGVFGISGGAAAQPGNIVLHAFPRSTMGEDGMMTMHDPMRMELTSSLAAGDTYSTTCSTIMPGFAGYAIARAGFRHAHGVAFVLGSFDGGATIDLAHGYLALVVPDPEFDNVGRGASSGESLGQ